MKAGQDALGKYGAGLSSVRFICGTQNIHKVKKLNLYFTKLNVIFNVHLFIGLVTKYSSITLIL